MRALFWFVLWISTLSLALHGCGGYDPVLADQLKIQQVQVRAVTPDGVRVTWDTNDLATSRVDYGPSDSVTTTFYITDRAGIGLDADGHIISQGRTNSTTQGPIINTVLDRTLSFTHSLLATQATTATTFSFALTSENARGQVAHFTVTLPKASVLLTPSP